MKIKRKFFVLIFLFASFAWAKINNSLYVAQTNWFEIIYPPECEKSARILYENADRIYEEVANLYGLRPSLKMPVVLTPAVDSFNAFWTSAPYNHIVIYDTSVSLQSELAVFSENLLSVFKHELTHAVTFNMKNPFWTAFSKIFGDSATPSSLWISSGMAEGATLTSESADGEGRLNDEFAKHFVKQAKIEGKFPNYYDVTGASDKYPVGSYYWFNGAFHQWLQENFGMQKYAEFWDQLVNLKSLTVGIAFKKIYELELKTAWEIFKNDYETPNVPANPLDSGLVQDFFISRNNFYSFENKIGSHFTSLSNSEKGIAWIDSYGGKIKYAPAPDPQAQKTAINSAETLFYLKNAQKIGLSQDNRFMAASYFSGNSAGTTARTKIWDFETKSFYKVKTNGLKESAIIQANGKYYLVAVKFESPKNALYIEEIKLNEKNRVYSTEFFDQKEFPRNVNISCFVQVEDGKFAFVKKDKSEYSIAILTFGEKNLDENCEEYKIPTQKTTVRSLSYDDAGKKFYFSWAAPGTMPRLGVLDVSQNRFLFSGEKGDLSGGIFMPVAFGAEIAYIAQFYKFSGMLKIPNLDDFFNSTDFLAYDCAPTSFYLKDFKNESEKNFAKSEKSVFENFESNENAQNSPAEFSAQNKISTENEKSAAQIFSQESEIASAENNGKIDDFKSDDANPFVQKKFDPFDYVLGGLFLPFSNYKTDYFAYNAYENPESLFLLGATFVTAAPWTNGANSLYSATFGYDFATKSLGVGLTGQNGTFSDFSAVNYNVKSEFNRAGWKNSGASVYAKLNFEVGAESSILLENKIGANLGFQDDLSGREKLNLKDYEKILPPDGTICYSFSEIFAATFSNVNKAGPLRYEKKGFSYTALFGYRYDGDFSENPKEYVNAIQISQDFKFYLPRMFPFYPKIGMTANFPTVFTISLFPILPQYLSYSYYDNFGKSIFDFGVETVLFATEIQRAIPFLHAIFLNDFCVSAGYVSSLATGIPLGYSNVYDYANFFDYAKLILNGKTAFLNSVFVKINISATPNLGRLATPGAKSDFYVKAYFSLRKRFFAADSDGVPVKIELGFFSLF